MSLRALGSAVIALVALAGAGCGQGSSRALVLADGTGVPHTAGVQGRTKFFQEKSGRQVRVLVVSGEQAVALASRGEADVALVPNEVSLDGFLAGEHGRMTGLFVDGGERLRVLEVNAQQHPKVDAKGAHDLASALSAP